MSHAVEPVWSKRSVLAIIVALAVCFAASIIGGGLTRPNLAWYATLQKPAFTPPDAAFPIIWTILYVMMAVSAWLVWRAPGDEGDRKTALVWFGIQLVVGIVWSVAFFWLHSPAYGLAVILALLAAIVIAIVLFDRLSRPAALLLIPYILWVCFAAGLNFSIWFFNR